MRDAVRAVAQLDQARALVHRAIDACNRERWECLRSQQDVPSDIEKRAQQARQALDALLEPATRAEQALSKALAEAERQGSLSLDQFDFMIREGTALMPPVDPYRSTLLVQASDVLTRCITTMAQNVAGHGTDIVCVLTPEERAKLSPADKKDCDQEEHQLRRLLRFCHTEYDWDELRRRMTSDKWSTGYCCVELLRNGRGEIVGLNHLASWTIRLTPLGDYVDSDIWIQDPDWSWRTEKVSMRWRMVIQMINGRYRYFRMLGDPRIINAFTGEVYDPADPRADAIRGSAEEAHDVLFFRMYGVSGDTTPYGLPPWLAASYSAAGRREAQEVNLLYFDNKAVPPLVVLVSGGQLTPESMQLIEERFKGLKGRDAFHDVLVLEALQGQSGDPMDPMGRNQVRINLVPMSQAMEKDALFSKYTDDCKTNIMMMFGIPPILLGISSDYNRATSDSAREVADQQAFQPERAREDRQWNTQLLPRMQIRFWYLRSKGAYVGDESTANAILQTALSNDGMTVNEARPVMSRMLGVNLPPVPWGNRPPSANKAMAQQGVDISDKNAKPQPPPPGAGAPGLPGMSGLPGKPPAPKSSTGPDKEPVPADSAPPDDEKKPEVRIVHAQVPEEWLRGAEVIEGVIHLRNKLHEELLARAIEDARKRAAA